MKEVKVINKNETSTSSILSCIIDKRADISNLKDICSALNKDFIRVSVDIQSCLTYVK